MKIQSIALVSYQSKPFIKTKDCDEYSINIYHKKAFASTHVLKSVISIEFEKINKNADPYFAESYIFGKSA